MNIELDIIAAISSGKFTVARDLLPKVQALNRLRYLLEEKAVSFTDHTFNTDAFVWVCSNISLINITYTHCFQALNSFWDNISVTEKETIIHYILELIINKKSNDLLNKLLQNEKLVDILNHPDVRNVCESLEEEISLPSLVEHFEWEFYSCNKKSMV